MDIAFILAQQIIVMFLLMGIGVFLDKKKMLSQDAVAQITNVLLNVVVSCVMINSFQADSSPELSRNFAYSLALSATAMFLGIVISTLIFKGKTLRTKLCIMGAAYSNSGFMAFPLLHATFGELGIFYGTAYVAVFNFSLWSHGVSVMSNDEKPSFKARVVSIAKAPVVISIFIGLATYFLNIKFPPIIGDVLGYVADLNTPLAMIIIGVFVSRCNFKGMFDDLIILPVVAVKLLLVPLVTIGLFMVATRFVELNETMLLSVLVCSAACTASTVVLFAKRFDRNVDFAVKMVTLSTLCCVVTIPLITAFSRVVL